jgi:hypothetical protein
MKHLIKKGIFIFCISRRDTTGIILLSVTIIPEARVMARLRYPVLCRAKEEEATNE